MHRVSSCQVSADSVIWMTQADLFSTGEYIVYFILPKNYRLIRSVTYNRRGQILKTTVEEMEEWCKTL